MGTDAAQADDLVLAVGVELIVAAVWIEGQAVGRDFNPHLQRPSLLVQGSWNIDQLAQLHLLREGEGQGDWFFGRRRLGGLPVGSLALVQEVFDRVSRAAGSTGGSKANNNMPPYLAVFMWQRVS